MPILPLTSPRPRHLRLNPGSAFRPHVFFPTCLPTCPINSCSDGTCSESLKSLGRCSGSRPSRALPVAQPRSGRRLASRSGIDRRNRNVLAASSHSMRREPHAPLPFCCRWSRFQRKRASEQGQFATLTDVSAACRTPQRPPSRSSHVRGVHGSVQCDMPSRHLELGPRGERQHAGHPITRTRRRSLTGRERRRVGGKHLPMHLSTARLT